MNATTDNKVPAIYGAMGEVLKALRVDKAGQLPTQLGGKTYITAADAFAAVKNLFADNHIVIIPTEKVVRYDTLVDSHEKVRFLIAVEGTYTLVSTVDGSTVTIGGAGDGTALGASVASNIASTNALKNALFRTFLISEQSVEDEAKQGSVSERPSPAQSKIDAARKASASAKSESSFRSKIRTEWVDTGKITRDRANELLGEAEANGLKEEAAYKWILEGLESGTLKAVK
ncbi:MAG: hypothetical protein M0R66_02165 [Candidatus Omnitrophica bacterium]|nr:hypothetical protein [Candidatus Omnitrophota bacterium]